MENEQVLRWLLEPDNPSARYLTLRTLLGRSDQEDDVLAARAAIPRTPPARAILQAQYPAGYWIKPDRGYSPRYKATIWQLIFMADLGAECTPAIVRACKHVLDHAIHVGYGLFSAHKHSTGVYPCLNGSMLRVLWHFGDGTHPQTRAVAHTLAACVAAEGLICVRNSPKARDKAAWQPCLWGGVRVLRGLAAIPAAQRTPMINRAIERCVDFVLGHDLTREQRPRWVDTPSTWLRLGFPRGYGSDLLEALLALTEAGVADKPDAALEMVRAKRDRQGRWPLERALRKTWADFGQQGAPNKWITLHALRVLREG